MGMKLKDPVRSKAIVNDAWDTVKRREAPPTWPYIGIVGIVDRMLAAEPGLDGRDISDALILCAEMDEAPTASRIRENMARIGRGRAERFR